MFRQLPAILRVLIWTSRNPYSLGSARIMAWCWTVAALNSIIAIGINIIGGDITWWWIPIQAGLLCLDVVMARHSWVGYLRRRALRDFEREFQDLIKGWHSSH